MVLFVAVDRISHTPSATLFDRLVDETKPEFLTFALDTFWFRQVGVDPARFFEKYPTRFQLMHLKDLSAGTKQDQTGMAPEEASVVVGDRSLLWQEFLHAVANSSITDYFLEDESPNAAAQVPRSLNCMHKVTF